MITLGYYLKSWKKTGTDQHSGSFDIWEESAAFEIKSANG